MQAVENVFEDAEAYERFMGRWSRLVAPRLVEFAHLPNEGRVLDVGCGTGSLAFAIAALTTRTSVLGIDPSAEYVAYAAGRNLFSHRATFQVGDAQQLDFPDACFEAALSLIAFNFIPDPRRALLELLRVIKPGGSLSAAVWEYGAGMRMLRTFWDAAVDTDPDAEQLDEKHMPFCRPGELAALWGVAGLENISEQSIDIEMKFQSFTDYWELFLLGQGPAGSYVQRLDRDRLQGLRDEVGKRLALPDETAPFVLSARVWLVRGIVPNRR